MTWLLAYVCFQRELNDTLAVSNLPFPQAVLVLTLASAVVQLASPWSAPPARPARRLILSTRRRAAVTRTFGDLMQPLPAVGATP